MNGEKANRTIFTKDNVDMALGMIKIVFYFATIGGVTWNLWYYGFVVHALPDFDAANLTAYLVAIFGIGFFLIIAFVVLFLLPGLILWGARKEEEEQERKEKEEKEKKGEKETTVNQEGQIENNKSAKPSLKVWLEQKQCESCKICNGYLLYIVMSIWIFGLSFLSWACPNNGSWITKGGLILLLLLFVGWWLWVKIPYKGSIFWSAVIFLLLPAMIALRFSSTVEASNSVGMAIVTFTAILFFASLVNGQVAIEGFGFLKDVENPLLNIVGGFLLIVLIVVLFFSNIAGLTNKPNPFLTAPYRILRIGQIEANLSLDDDFVKKTLCKGAGELCETTFKFKILSSIGTEYIVETLNEAGQTPKRILRIPKEKVLLVEYEK